MLLYSCRAPPQSQLLSLLPVAEQTPLRGLELSLGVKIALRPQQPSSPSPLLPFQGGHFHLPAGQEEAASEQAEGESGGRGPLEKHPLQEAQGGEDWPGGGGGAGMKGARGGIRGMAAPGPRAAVITHNPDRSFSPSARGAARGLRSAAPPLNRPPRL